MNLGLRDAVSLAPYIVDHMKQSAGLATLGELQAIDETTLQVWATDRHAKALKVIALAKTAMQYSTWKDEITWYYGFIPVNWVKVRNFIMTFGRLTGITTHRVPYMLSGLQNR